jgi:plastocyanin
MGIRERIMDDLTAFAFETITVASASTETTLTSTSYNPAGRGLPVKKATIYVNPGPNVRFTLEGTTVTTGTGHAITAFMTYDVFGHENIKNFKCTSSKSATTGEITVTYFR